MIENIKRNCVGTVSFDGKFPGFRKAQDFTTYPIADGSGSIMIQSENYFGTVCKEIGKVTLSSRRPYANTSWLAYCIGTGKAKEFTLPPEDFRALIDMIKTTAGKEVGDHGLKADNSAAVRLI